MKTSNVVLTAGTLLVVGLYIVFWYSDLGFSSGATAAADRGQFGDKFGALNTLFTGLALVGLIATLFHAREDAADRDRDHNALLRAMALQSKIQTEAALLTAWTTRWSTVHKENDKNSFEGIAWEASVESIRNLQALMRELPDRES